MFYKTKWNKFMDLKKYNFNQQLTSQRRIAILVPNYDNYLVKSKSTRGIQLKKVSNSKSKWYYIKI